MITYDGNPVERAPRRMAALFYLPTAGRASAGLGPANAALCDAALRARAAVAAAEAVVADCCGPLEAFRSGGGRDREYGEIAVASLAEILAAAAARRTIRSFYDVGCGRGAAAIAAAVLGAAAHGLETSSGVEIDDRGAAAAAAATAALAAHPFGGDLAAECRALAGDGLAPGPAADALRRADLVYCCWTAFSEKTRARFAAAFVRGASPGALLAVLSHALPPPTTGFALVARFDVATTWAPRVPCYIYARTDDA